MDFLLREGIYQEYSENPEETLKALSVELRNTKNRRLLAALVDLTYLQAKRSDDEDKAVYYYLSSCIYAYVYLFKSDFEDKPSPFEAEYLFACRFYNYSSAEVFQYLKNRNLLTSSNINLPFLNGSIKFLPPVNHLPSKLDAFSSFEICYKYTPFGFHSSTRQSGLGVPLIGVGKRTLTKRKDEIMDASKVAYPATLFIRFDSPEKDKFSASMEYYDPMNQDTIEEKGQKVPLEVDLSTYLGWMLRGGAAYSPIEAMMDTSIMDKLKGLYILTPYDKNKIPVVFVHGVLSYPRTWVQTINTLLKDPKIRENYQFWLFAYPTGNPVLYSSAKLREELLKAQKAFDPEGNSKFKNMVIVAHSMGGLLTKGMIQNSGDKLLKEYIGNKSLDDFDLTDEEKAFVKRLLIYKSLPFVDRVIFISVPHKGSTMTRWWVAELAATFINLPGKLAGKMYDVQKKILIDSGLKKDHPINIPTGVDNLDPDNRALLAIDKLPYDKNVPYHSIIGNNEKGGVPGGTDGIVQYSSAHLDDAVSELIIKSGHGAHAKPKGIKEIKRILLKHLEEN